jgi:hypothetical protein
LRAYNFGNLTFISSYNRGIACGKAAVFFVPAWYILPINLNKQRRLLYFLIIQLIYHF